MSVLNGYLISWLDTSNCSKIALSYENIPSMLEIKKAFPVPDFIVLHRSCFGLEPHAEEPS